MLANYTLRDLDAHGRHIICYAFIFKFITYFSFTWLDTEANNFFTIELTDYMMLHYLQVVILNMLFVQSLIPKLII